LKWLEEPVWPPENFDGLARVRGTDGIPLAAGENVVGNQVNGERGAKRGVS
jgi:L-alanine-DL-glutamate epimerase-like enolase superfamily enzyme